MNMPNMLAFTIRGGGQGSNITPQVLVGSTSNTVQFTPQNPSDDTYWIAILDANKPTTLVKDFLIPGSSNSTVPAGLDAYMSNPNYIYAVTTQFLSTIHVPQGDWYDYLVKYGASRELQSLEQVNSSIGCGSLGQVGYVLIGQGGPRGGSNIPPPTYETSTIFEYATILMMSLMPMPNGSPPYSLCDSYTFVTR
ncbi:MAG: hypothetical protein AABN95_16565 [Acidobacteriota bacterium]